MTIENSKVEHLNGVEAPDRSGNNVRTAWIKPELKKLASSRAEFGAAGNVDAEGHS